MSVRALGCSAPIYDILEMLDDAVKDVGADTVRGCTVLVEAALEDPEPERNWKELMSFEDLEDRSEIVSIWTARGEARALLRVLEAREIRISDEFRQRIRFCDDENLIRLWLRRAATATDEADILT
jgi:hypothetical protein